MAGVCRQPPTTATAAAARRGPRSARTASSSDRDGLAGTHDVAQRLAPHEGGQLLADQGHRPRGERAGVSPDVRADQHARAAPQRVVVGQRLGVGDVEGRHDATGGRRLDEGVGVDDLAARHVDQERAVRHGRQEVAVDQAGGRRAERDDHHHDVVVRQQPGQLVDAVHLRHEVVPGAGPGRDRGERHLEAREPAGDGPPDGAVAEDQHPLVGERRPAAEGDPPGPVLRAHHVGHPAQRRQRQRDRELGGGRVVHPGGVREGDTGREQRQHVVVPGGQQLHRAQRGQQREAPERRPVTDVRRHDQLDLVAARRLGDDVPGDGLDAGDGADHLDPLGVGQGDDRHDPTVSATLGHALVGTPAPPPHSSRCAPAPRAAERRARPAARRTRSPPPRRRPPPPRCPAPRLPTPRPRRPARRRPRAGRPRRRSRRHRSPSPAGSRCRGAWRSCRTDRPW